MRKMNISSLTQTSAGILNALWESAKSVVSPTTSGAAEPGSA
jgi:hypothetical protein